MKKQWLVAFAVTLVAAVTWAVWSGACDGKNSSGHGSRGHDGKAAAAVSAGNGACTAASAAGCTAHDASVASSSGCPYANGNATAAHAGCSKAGAATAGMDCEGHGTAATVASNAGHDCGGSNGKNAGAMAGQACGQGEGFVGAGMLGAPSCAAHGGSMSAAGGHGNCDACSDMMSTASVLSANGVQTQVVPLKNGVMFVYTTDTPAHVRAVQNALARRSDRLNVLAVSGDHARLCPECRNIRGAIASGKLTRETVNIEGGCLTLVTSSDPAMVAKLRSMALASQANGRNKS